MHRQPEKVSLYESLTMLKASWMDVSAATIMNSWKKSGVQANQSDHEENILLLMTLNRKT